MSFNSESDALETAKRAWILYVKDMFDKGKPIRNGGDILTTLGGLSDDDISKLMVCGYRGEDVQKDEGLTLSYIIIHKAHKTDDGTDKWYCGMIPDEYLVGSSGYKRMVLPDNWKHPMLINILYSEK